MTCSARTAASNKQQPYDESIRIPLLMRWPAGLEAEPRRLDAPITLEDLMPTILGLCGLAIPPERGGASIYSGYLRSGKDSSDGCGPRSAASAPFGAMDPPIGGREYRGIRTRRVHLRARSRRPVAALRQRNRSLSADNLVGRPEYARLQAELAAILATNSPRSTTNSCRRRLTSGTGVTPSMPAAWCVPGRARRMAPYPRWTATRYGCSSTVMLPQPRPDRRPGMRGRRPRQRL